MTRKYLEIKLEPGHGLSSEVVAEIELLERNFNCDADEYLKWRDAIRAVDQKRDPKPLLALLNVPAKAAPLVEDLFERKLGSGLSRRGPKIPLSQKITDLAEAVAFVRMHINLEGMTVGEAVDRVLKGHPDIAKKISREKLINHYTGKSGHGRRAKKKRQP